MKKWLLDKFYHFFFQPNCRVMCVCPRVCISVCVRVCVIYAVLRYVQDSTCGFLISGCQCCQLDFGWWAEKPVGCCRSQPCVHREEGIYLLTILQSWARLEGVAAPGSKRVSDGTRWGFWTSWLFSPGHLRNVENKGLVQSWWTSNSIPWWMLYGRREKVIEALALKKLHFKASFQTLVCFALSC